MRVQARAASSNAKIGGLLALVLLLVLAWWKWGRGETSAMVETEVASQHEPGRARGFGEREPELLVGLAGQPKATITGNVRTRGGGPIAGARVCVWAASHELRGLGDRWPSCTTSAADGRYRIDGLWPVAVNVDASAAEHRPQRWRPPGAWMLWNPQIRLRPGQIRDGVDFELEAGGAKITGVVVDISGGEIEGALVSTYPGNFQDEPVVPVLTDDQGRFELWSAPGMNRVVAQAEGYAEESVPTMSPSAQVEILLTPESILVGYVVHAQTGEPLADVTVSTQEDEYRSRAPITRTDAEGRFRLVGLRPGTFKPIVRDDNFYGTAELSVQLGLGQTSEPIEIRAHPATLVEGRIVEAGTDQGCGGCYVQLSSADTTKRIFARGDEQGRVRLRGVLPGSYEVRLDCMAMLEDDELPALVVGSEGPVEVIWEVRAGQAIRGVVVDAAGEPVADTTITAGMAERPREARAHTAQGRTLADGSFEIAGLPPSTYVLRVGGDHPQAEPPLEVTLEPGSDLEGVRIELPAVAVIEGRVLDERGAALASVTVVARQLSERGSSRTRTDDQGHFVLEHVEPGQVRVAADRDRWGQPLRAPGSTDDDEQGAVVEAIAGQRTSVELVVASLAGSIRGVVKDTHGVPVSDAFVEAARMSDSATDNAGANLQNLRWGGGSRPSLTDVDGSFVIEGLASGGYMVLAQRRGGGEAIAENVEAGSGTIVLLTIVENGALAGMVTSPDGAAPERFSVSATDEAQGLFFRDEFFRTEGRWELRELPAGNYEIRANATIGVAETTVALAAAEHIDDIELVLPRRVTVVGRLVDADTGAPVPDMIVTIGDSGMSRRGKPPGKTLSDAQGRFEVDGVAPGEADVVISPYLNSDTSAYARLRLHRTITGAQDIGDIRLIAQRLASDQRSGDLGYELRNNPPKTAPADMRLEVALIRPGGPAAIAGLAVGDVIESVDGKSVAGAESDYYWGLTRVPEGTTLVLGLAGGKTVSLSVGPPR
jgi:protocatechuate 3,4-dioxygenase beta subunit